MSATDFKKNVLALPWVKAVKGDVPCEGIKWGSVSRADHLAHLRGNTPEKMKCKRGAKYIFRATKRVRAWEYPAQSGSYCAVHLSMQLSDYQAEQRRADAFFTKNGWWRNGVFGFHKIGDSE